MVGRSNTKSHSLLCSKVRFLLEAIEHHCQMGIHRSILNYDTLRYCDTQRGEVPYRLDPMSHHKVGDLLGIMYGDCKYPHRNIRGEHLRDLIHVVYGQTADKTPTYIFRDIESRHNLQAILIETSIRDEGCPQVADAKYASLVTVVEAQEVFQDLDHIVDIIAHPCLAGKRDV